MLSSAIKSNYRWAMDTKGLNNLFLSFDDARNDLAIDEKSNQKKLSSYKKSICTIYSKNASGNLVASAHGESGVHATDKGAVAVINLVGTMYPRWNSEMWWNGGVDMGYVRDLLDMIEENPNINSVVFYVDSGGGTVDGTENLANRIASFRKPTIAYIENNCFSAAYWVASQCDYILAGGRTSYAGSIGVRSMHVNREKQYEMFGVDITYLSADQSTKKIIAPDNKELSDEDRALIESELTQDARIFINAVKKGRKESNLDIDSISHAEIASAKNAVDIGLIDKVSTTGNGLNEAIKKAQTLSNKINQMNKSSIEISKNKSSAMELSNIKNLQLKVANVGNSVSVSNGVLVSKEELESLNAAFEGFNEPDVLAFSDEEKFSGELDFASLGIKAKKANMFNVVTNRNASFIVNGSHLEQLNSLVTSMAEDKSDAEKVQEVLEGAGVTETVETETETPAPVETEIETEIEIETVETETETVEDSSETVETPVTETETVETVVAETETPAPVETATASNDLRSQMADLMKQISENQKENQKAFSSLKNENQKLQEELAKEKEANLKVNKQFGGKIISPTPIASKDKIMPSASMANLDDDQKVRAIITAAKNNIAERELVEESETMILGEK